MFMTIREATLVSLGERYGDEWVGGLRGRLKGKECGRRVVGLV